MAVATRDLLLSLVRALDDAELPFMVVGAFAVMAHGLARTSGDIDVVVHLPFDQRERAKAPLMKIGATEFEERKDEFGQRLVAGLPNGLQVEVFFTPARAPYDEEYSRRVTMPLDGLLVPFLSPEDLILRKLVNCRLRRSMDYPDAVGVLAVQGDAIDLAYLRSRCGLYRVCGLLDRALKEAKAAQPDG